MKLAFANNSNKQLCFLLVSIMFSSVTFGQIEETKNKDNILLFNPSIRCIQVDAVSIILANQLGGEFDFDILQSKNKNFGIGTRLGIEHYYLNNLVDRIAGSPFTNYNLLARASANKGDILFSIFCGVTYYKANSDDSSAQKYLFRTGFEIKYGNTFGFLLKGSTSLIKNSSFIGIGVYLGYNNN